MAALPIRFIHVTDVQQITPRTARVTFGGDDLADLAYDEPDQQVKLYFPKPGQTVPRLPDSSAEGDFYRWYQEFTAIPEDEQPWQRSYTLRAHHPDRRLVDVDFVLHEHAGPATRWAQAARPGDALAMFGPSADFARPIPLRTAVAEADFVLLAGDETALPAIGSLLESLPGGSRAVAYLEVADAAEEQRFDTLGEVAVHWLHRGEAPPGRSGLLLDAVRGAELPSGRLLAWLACEASEVRALRRHLIGERGLPRHSVEFTGHWRLARTQDDAPTEDDLAEARERLADAQATPKPE
ncbi:MULTISPECIES: siderophore-interacting protein [Actinoalloteichus]|uniref:Siderophore-interacting protein n=1 Tax=Actinoalloteichus fjordicus TaxID=1612552 RepID=A0AAC9LI08_9PSEU|nr:MULTISPECIES: siderophore-interacting protein [Actinoalloteichus]APU16694.1 siderophore-interacting protein [Actinoalloteichus fjordicus]APU22760.1 siderophore-interacting protein [Actinoalloteichus sp. GBA129-24]